jgi:hypothetical protein
MWCLHRTLIFMSVLSSFSHEFFPTTQRDERVLVAWSDNLETIIPLCRDFEGKLTKLIWTCHVSPGVTPGPSIPATPALTSAVNSSSEIELNEKPQEQDSSRASDSPDPNAKPISGGSLWGWRIGSKSKTGPCST